MRLDSVTGERSSVGIDDDDEALLRGLGEVLTVLAERRAGTDDKRRYAAILPSECHETGTFTKCIEVREQVLDPNARAESVCRVVSTAALNQLGHRLGELFRLIRKKISVAGCRDDTSEAVMRGSVTRALESLFPDYGQAEHDFRPQVGQAWVKVGRVIPVDLYVHAVELLALVYRTKSRGIRA